MDISIEVSKLKQFERVVTYNVVMEMIVDVTKIQIAIKIIAKMYRRKYD